MQIQKLDIGDCVKSARTENIFNQALGAVVLGLMFSTLLVPGSARAEADQDQTMDHSKMDMDHMKMDDSKMDMGDMKMDHSHHIAGKAGVYKTSVVSYTVPNVKLMDMNRTGSSLTDELGSHSPVILNFVFTTCTTICPLMSATFQQVQDKLGPKRANVRMVSISIDPENDTPEKLKDYVKRFHMGPQWKMLTGTIEDSISVQRSFGIYAGEKMNHKPVTFIKAQGVENTWLRIDGLAKATDILRELDQLSSKKSM